MPRAPRRHQARALKTRRHVQPTVDRQATREFNTGSKAWRAIRREVLERDRYQCQDCGRVVVGRKAHVDHIDGDSTNNPTDGSNWQTLCNRCHSSKTALEHGFSSAGARSRGGVG